MTGRILVKQRVVKEMSALGNRGAGRNKRNFTQPCGAFIGIYQFLQERFILFRRDFDDFPVLKRDRKIFDQAAAIAKRECGRNNPICPMTIWQGKNFFCWHIGGEGNAIFCQRLRADPFVSIRQAQGEICFIRFIV